MPRPLLDESRIHAAIRGRIAGHQAQILAEVQGAIAAHAVGAAVNETDDHHSDIQDVKLTEWIAWSPFLLAIVVFGVYPNLLFKVIDPASQVILKAFGKG